LKNISGSELLTYIELAKNINKSVLHYALFGLGLLRVLNRLFLNEGMFD